MKRDFQKFSNIYFLCVLIGFFINLALVSNSIAFVNSGEPFSQWNSFLGDTNIDKVEGISLEFVYTGELFGNFSGGTKIGSRYMANIDLTLTLDTEKAGWWPGGTFFFYGLNNHGNRDGDFSGDLVGDLQGVSNIEASDFWRLYEAWYEQIFFDGIFSLLLGYHDMNSEFDVTEFGGLFLNSSFGIGPEFGGVTAPSIFPVVAPAVRVKLQPNDAFYVQAAVYDGNPGDQDVNNNGLEFRLSSSDGAMSIYEMGYSIGQDTLPGTYKVGGWHHTASKTDEAGNPHSDNYGFYFVADQLIIPEQAGGDQGLGLFIQIGKVPDDRNEVDLYVGGGVNYHGLLPGRDEDDFGIAVAHASISKNINMVVPGVVRDSAETVFEITYLANLLPWFSIQPDFQYIINPGADPAIENALVGGLRFGIVLK